MFPDAQNMQSTQNWNMEHFKPITPDRPSLPPLPCKNCHNVVPSLEDEDQELPHEKWRAKTGRIRSRRLEVQAPNKKNKQVLTEDLLQFANSLQSKISS
jgi:hypothetical protein